MRKEAEGSNHKPRTPKTSETTRIEEESGMGLSSPRVFDKSEALSSSRFSSGLHGWMDGWMDGWTDGQTDRQTDPQGTKNKQEINQPS